MKHTSWTGFIDGEWNENINVRDFIQKNYSPYEGDDSFLETLSESTKEMWDDVLKLIKIENSTHAPVDFDDSVISTITSHEAGYINKKLEKIVGLQTEAPLKRAIIPFGGIRMVETSCEVYGKKLDKNIKDIFTKYRKTHNEGVFDIYSKDVLLSRKTGLLTGLPDAYGRGRIIGDYRRIALYGMNRLIEDKIEQKSSIDKESFSALNFQLKEEIAEQIKALKEIKQMAQSYGYDISEPANTAQEAIQYLYFGYLAAIKSQNGAAMSLGRTSTFVDIYIQRDLDNGLINEKEAQELVDHFIMKLRMVRFLRTPEYDSLFSGDPIWATESMGGMGLDGRTLVTKSSFRYLNSLFTMGPSPEPNITVLWSESLPYGFKAFCSKVSIETSSIQYENDDLMRPDFDNDDYAIACCVSPMVVGKHMQFFGARANLAKGLLYSLNGGFDEVQKNIQVFDFVEKNKEKVLSYDEVFNNFDKVLSWLAKTYVDALNAIHFMHDKYSYEAALMALHDRDVIRTMACGIAGLSIAADSLSAIKYAQVTPIRDENGIAIDFDIKGDYPKFGNNDNRVDDIACELVERFMNKIKENEMYRDAIPTQSILTITSNVVYGKKTGTTPDGRKSGEPFAPGANPMHGRDEKGAVASLTSVGKLPFAHAKDGISYTFSIVPNALGKEDSQQINNLVGLMDGYFHHEDDIEGGQHLNVNVLNRETLLDAVEHPENYPQLTIRVSGYAVRFNSLTPEQQQDVIRRTFTASL